MKYDLEFTTKADRMLAKYIKNNPVLAKKFRSTFEKLTEEQFSPTLGTHKIFSKDFGMAYSTRVTGDLRIIWNYRKNQITILIYTIGSHSGKKAVY
jgi:mRNA-degrading endonuclease YafQ of YafQ-DinJ toxin-antitoxin module